MVTKKKIRLYWSVLCRKVVIDKETNNLILGEVIEEIQYELAKAGKQEVEVQLKKNGYIGLPAEACLVSYLEYDANSEGQLKVEFLSPDGKSLLTDEIKVQFSANGRGRSIHLLPALRVSGPGRHLVRVFDASGSEAIQLAELPLFVSLNYV